RFKVVGQRLRLVPRSPVPVAAQVDGDLEQPRREASRRVEAGAVTDHAPPGFLEEIFDVMATGVSMDEARQWPFVTPQELTQRALVAARQTGGELFIRGHGLRIA